ELALYLRRGGFLFAEACCGREAFAASFRRLMAAMFPKAELKRLEPGHPILSGRIGFNLDGVDYRPAVKREQPELQSPELWGIDVDGRTVVVFSPYGIGCGLEDHQCFNCRGVSPEDARKLATNIILYALQN